MQVKPLMRYHLTTIQMTHSQEDKKQMWAMTFEKRELSCTVVGNVTWYGYSRRQHGDSSKSRKRATIKSRSSTSGHLSQERATLNIYVFVYVCVCVCVCVCVYPYAHCICMSVCVCIYVCVYVCIPMLIAALFIITKIWKWPKHPTWTLNCSPQRLGLILWMTEVLERFE